MRPRRRLRIWRNRLVAVFSKDKLDDSLDREMAFHLEQQVQENIAAGMPAELARTEARRTFGNVPLLAESCRDQRRTEWIHDLKQDLGYGVRMLRGNLRFTIVAAASLALGVGANTAILSTLVATTRGALPLPDADRLVLLRSYSAQSPAQTSNASVPEFLRWQERTHSFKAIGLSIANRQDLGSEDSAFPPENLTGQAVTPSLFRAIGIVPSMGRTFTEDEGRVESPAAVIVLSHRLWQRRFGGNRDILNRRIEMDGKPFIVIGVMPPGFWYPHEECEYWIPLGLTQAQKQGSGRLFSVTARLKDGVSRQQAQAELDAVTAELAHDSPERQREWRARLVPLREFWFNWLFAPLLLLESAGALILLIACTNVATLLLVRAKARAPEFALRLALGANRTRVFRQLLTEGALLSVLGGAGGLAVAWACLKALMVIQPPPAGVHVQPLGLNVEVLSISLLLCLLCGLVFGAGPALSLRENALRARGVGLRDALVAVQIGMALILLVSSGLLVKSLIHMAREDRGFDVDGLLSFQFRIPHEQYLRAAGSYQGTAVSEATSNKAVLDQVYSRLQAIPGVESVAGVSAPLVNALVVPTLTVLVEGRPGPATASERDTLSSVHLVMTPGYFQTVRATLVRGRDVGGNDIAASPWVAVVNESMARRFWPGEDPIGKRFHFDVMSGEQPRTVVGVVHDMAQMLGGNTNRPVVYTSYEQQPERYRGPFANQFGQITFVLRGTGDSASLLPAVRKAVAEVDPHRAVSNVMSIVWWGGLDIFNRSIYGVVLLSFSAVAVLLASMGVYGVTAYSASQRTREMAIRFALGARVSELRGLLCRRAAGLIAVGVGTGVAGALAVTQFLNFLLRDVSPQDPAIFVGAITVLVLVAFAASFAPARRITEASPAAALRSE